MEPTDNLTFPLTNDSEPARPRPRLWLGILGVTIALSAPAVQALLIPWFESTFPFPLGRFVSLWIFWIAAVLVLAIAYSGEGYPLATFGFGRSQKTLRARLIEWILAVSAALVVAIILIPTSQYLRSLLTDEPAAALDVTAILPVWVMIPAWITGSFTEELLFRSYPIERLTQMTGRPWLAAVITLLAFALLHLFTWDWVHVLTLGLPASILLTLLYLWRRNLAFVVIVHAVLNAPLLILPLIAPYL
jgi:membrane protease YdiL (CAAX protease family)